MTDTETRDDRVRCPAGNWRDCWVVSMKRYRDRARAVLESVETGD